MAGTVQKRTCFYDLVGGTIRPAEWAVILYSGFGPLVEVGVWPFESNWLNPGNTRANDDFSPSNDWQRVDEFIRADDDGIIKALNFGADGSDGNPWFTGGRHFPRTGL